MDKTIYLLCNAHLDPVWLWQKDEGIAEALSTFRIAAEICEQTPGFVFNHNESVLYEWILEHDPALFERIKALVAAGKWHIMGGWYLQPDCVMTSGESLIRQIRVGREFFRTHFGVTPTTAINFDPFGHSRGLVQILKKCGYDSYVFMRPPIPEYEFIWRGFDGSEILAHHIIGGYNTPAAGKAVPKIKAALDSRPMTHDSMMVLWGIGDHGGGPSRLDLQEIDRFAEQYREAELIHSDCESYFKTVPRQDLPIVERSLTPVMIGCYTSMARIKQQHRALENRLALCEQMLVQSAVPYSREELAQAEKALLFNEFHDILPGSCIKPSEEEALRRFGYADELLDRMILRSFLALCGDQPKAEAGEIPIMVYNPHPYPIDRTVTVEFNLSGQNWSTTEHTVFRLCDEHGGELPCQREKPDCTMNLDWRHKLVFSAHLEPMSVARYRCFPSLTSCADEAPPTEQTQDEFIFKTATREVRISKRSGLISSFSKNGVPLLRDGGALTVFEDNEDPWRMDTDRFDRQIGAFRLMTEEEANDFNGYPDQTFPPVRIVETGALRTVLQAFFCYHRSYAMITYTVSHISDEITAEITLWINDVNRLVKWHFPTLLSSGCEALGQTAFGTERLAKDGSAQVFHQWAGLRDDAHSFFVLNTGTYSGNMQGSDLDITLLRTPVYSAHPIEQRDLAPKNRRNDHIDLGQRTLRFALTADCPTPDFEAALLNREPITLSFFPSGEGTATPPFSLAISDRTVLLSACRHSENGILLRFYHAGEGTAETAVRIGNADFPIHFGSFEVKTFLFRNDTLTETDLLGQV